MDIRPIFTEDEVSRINQDTLRAEIASRILAGFVAKPGEFLSQDEMVSRSIAITDRLIAELEKKK